MDTSTADQLLNDLRNACNEFQQKGPFSSNDKDYWRLWEARSCTAAALAEAALYNNILPTGVTLYRNPHGYTLHHYHSGYNYLECAQSLNDAFDELAYKQAMDDPNEAFYSDSVQISHK